MITFRRMQVSTSVKISLIMIKTCQIYAQRLGALTRNWMANYWLCLTIRSRVGGTENWLNMCDGTKTFTLTPKHCKLFLYLFWWGTAGRISLIWDTEMELAPWTRNPSRGNNVKGVDTARKLSEESTMEHVFKQSWYKSRLPSFLNRRLRRRDEAWDHNESKYSLINASQC